MINLTRFPNLHRRLQPAQWKTKHHPRLFRDLTLIDSVSFIAFELPDSEKWTDFTWMVSSPMKRLM